MIREAHLRIHVNGAARILLACSPHDPVTLATGHLLAEGWIDHVREIHDVSVRADGVHFTLPVERVLAFDARRAALLNGGDVPFPAVPPGATAVPPGATAMSPEEPVRLLRALFTAVDERAPDGGLHGAAASDGADLVHIAWDVARHCCVDRVIGARAGAGEGPAGLVTTARVSGAMAAKAARTGFRWIVTRGLATSIAHEIARRGDIQIIERAGRGERR